MGFRKSPVLRVESVGEQTFGLVPEDDGDDGVGVLGWLGFLIINLAAWGFIGSSAQMHWMAGFCICALYTCALISFACWLEGQMRYRQFVNLLWVLACTFVFVSGGLLTGAVSDIVYGDSQGDIFDGEVYWQQPDYLDISSVMPATSGPGLQQWWAHGGSNGKPFATFYGHTLFSEGNRLWISDGTTIIKVFPELSSPRNMYHRKDAVFFLASRGEWPHETTDLWAIRSSGVVAESAELVSSLESSMAVALGSWHAQDLFLNEESDKFYFTVKYQCNSGAQPGATVRTVIESDGTTAGTTDLRANVCGDLAPLPAPTPWTSAGPKSVCQKLCLLFFGILPMAGLSAWVLATKQLPGVFLNLFAAFNLFWTVVYVLITDEGLTTFVKVFNTIYAVLLYSALALVSLKLVHPPTWLDELKTWGVVPVGLLFFVMMHVLLGIPSTTSVWLWLVYVCVVFFQMAMSFLIARAFPMVLAGVGLFLTAIKISNEFVQLLNVEAGLSNLLMLALVGLQGFAVIGAAIFYTSKRRDVNKRLRLFQQKLNGQFLEVEQAG